MRHYWILKYTKSQSVQVLVFLKKCTSRCRQYSGGQHSILIPGQNSYLPMALRVLNLGQAECTAMPNPHSLRSHPINKLIQKKEYEMLLRIRTWNLINWNLTR